MGIDTYFLPYSTIETNTNSIYVDYFEGHHYNFVNIPPTIDLANLDLTDSYIIPPTIIQEETFRRRVTQLNPKIINADVEHAISLAKKVHKDQYRNSGEDYLTGHLLPVGLYL